MVGVWTGLAAVLAQAPDAAADRELPSALPLAPRLDVRSELGHDTDRKPVLPRLFGPQPPPELGGHHEKDDVTVSFSDDGTAKAHVPPDVRGAAGICVLGMCLSTRGIRRGPDPEKTMRFSTAPIPIGFALGFGYAPASPNAAARMLADTSQQRMEQRLAWTRAHLEATRRQMGQRLAALLHDPELTLAAKRAIVGELWADALQTARAPVADGDALAAARAQGADAIAATIGKFARRHFPGVSPPEDEPTP